MGVTKSIARCLAGFLVLVACEIDADERNFV